MKNLFCILVTYTKPIHEIEQILAEHRAYLQKGYDAGFLLVSGPQNPKIGGCILGHFADKDAAIAFTHNDPYYLNNAATYEIIEFSPVLHAKCIKEFVQD